MTSSSSGVTSTSARHTSGAGLRSARLAVLLTLGSAGLALGLCGLLTPPVCLLTLLLLTGAGVAVPMKLPWLVQDSPQRTMLALAAMAGLVLGSATAGPGALGTGGLQGALGDAAGQLALPAQVPLGLLATLLAGALVAITLELGDRRGLQSALILSTATLALAGMADPGGQLLVPLLVGWPAALVALTRLAAAADRENAQAMLILPTRSSERPSWWPGRRRWPVLPVAAAIGLALAVLGLALLTGVTSLSSPTAWLAGHGASGLSPGGGRSVSEYLGGDMDLSTRGALGDQAVVEVPAGSPTLWRAGTLDIYTGRGWLATTAPTDQPTLHRSGEEATVVPASGAASGAASGSGSGSGSGYGSGSGSGSGSASGSGSGSGEVTGPVTEYRVRPALHGALTQVLAPGRLVSVLAASVKSGGIDSSPGDRVTLSGSAAYTVRAQTLPSVDDAATDRELRSAAASAGAGDPADARWTALPSEVPQRVRVLGVALARSGGGSRVGAVQAVERELDRRVTYQLDSPVPPRGADAVDNVLFVSHRGFCEQFASAEVVLLRAAGIPARVAVGFSGGQDQPSGERQVTRSQAHAWVEVWFPGVGWVTSDPTPAGTASSTWWQPAWTALTRSARRAVVPLGVVPALVLLAAAGRHEQRVRRQRRERRLALEAARRLDAELAAAFERLETMLAAQGRGRAPGETVAALSRRLPGELAPALAVLDRALYARTPPSAQQAREAGRRIRAALDAGLSTGS